MAHEIQIFLDLTPYSLRALRAVGGVVESAGESLLENKAGVEALLDSVCPDRKVQGLKAAASVWPVAAAWHVSTDTEAMLDRTAEAIGAIAGAGQRSPLIFAVCNAGDGGAVTAEGIDPWVLAHTPQSSQDKASQWLRELKVETDGASPGAFAVMGALIRALRSEGKEQSVALWDLGAESSHLVLVSAKGVEAVAPCTVGMNTVFGAVQSALKLKFRGAGERLFFNEGYDFTDSGPKVGAAVAAGLKQALAELPPPQGPLFLACLGLTQKQSWFVRESALATGLEPWGLDSSRLASEFGLRFADESIAASVSSSVGLLGLVALATGPAQAWRPAWAEFSPPPEESVTAEEPAFEPGMAPKPSSEVEPPPPPVRAKPSLSFDEDRNPAAPAPKVNRPTVKPRTVGLPPFGSVSAQGSSTRPPVPVSQTRPVSAPAPAPKASFTLPEPTSRAPAFPAPEFPAPQEAPSAPAPALRPLSFPRPGGVIPVPGGSASPHATPAFPMPGGNPSAPKPPVRPPSFSNPGFPAPGGAASLPEPDGSFPSASNPGFPEPKAGPQFPSEAGPSPEPTAPSFPLPGAPVPGRPMPGVTALPFEKVKLKSVLAGVAGPPEPAAVPETPKSRMGFYVGVGVAAAVVFAVIAIVVEARLEKIKADDLQKQEALALKLREQELTAKEKQLELQKEEDRKVMEAQVEEAKKKAAEDERKRMLEQAEAERLSRLPGNLAVVTVPAGAAVSVDGAAPVKAPANIGGLSPGTHSVQISLPGFDPVVGSVIIHGSRTTDMGSVTLEAMYGAVELTSTPDNLDFVIRPAGEPAGKPIKTGRTPASFSDLAHGDYTVTYSRPGCRDHTEAVTIRKGVKTSVDTKYQDGSLELSSDPSGARVYKDGEDLGTTPLVLHDLTPKMASFELKLPGYDVTPISCQIPEGDTLKYSAKLLLRDRIFTPSEVKTAPESYEAPAPILSAAQRAAGADIVLSLVVRRDGSVTGVEIVQSTDDDIARRCKRAVEKWRFHPATAPDDRIVDSRIEIPFKFPAGGK